MFDNYNTDPIFNVKAMAHQTNVAAATLRAWERRYGVPTPPRTESGYRLYSTKDVAIIRWLKSQIENGMSISQAVQLLRSVEGHSSNGHDDGARVVSSTQPSSFQRLQEDIVAAAIEFNEEQIEQALGEAFSLFVVEDVCLNLIQPMLVALGNQWHTGEINVNVEHFATNIVRRKLLALMATSPAPSRSVRIVSACAPGEYHEIGILMLSLFLRRGGYNIIYLGQSISEMHLEEMLAKTRPDVLLISASGLLAAANLLEIVEEIRSHDSHAGLIVAFGGRVFNRLPELQKCVPGLFIGDDAKQAMGRIVELVASASGSPFTADMPSNGLPLAKTLTQYRLRSADIVSVATRITETRLGSTYIHKRALEAHQNLCEILDAALRFNFPAMLANANNWQWDAMPRDGIGLPQLHKYATILIEATRQVLLRPAIEVMEPFLLALESSFAVQTIEQD